MAEDARTSARIFRLVRLYMLLWLFEGAARKWGPAATQEIFYFLRVPVIIILAGQALKGRGGQLAGSVSTSLTGLLLVLVLAFGNVIAGRQDAFSAILGARLYIEPWLVPVLAMGLTRSHGDRLMRLLVRLAIPITALAVLQARSSPFAYVNKLLLADRTDVFKNFEAVRASGTFTSSLGHSLFVILVFAVCLGSLIDGAGRCRRLHALGVLGALIMAVTGGSRTTAIGMVLVALVGVTTYLSRHPTATPRILALGMVFGALSLMVAPRLAPGAVSAFERRVQVVGSAELRGRATAEYTDWFYQLPNAESLGNGLGSGALGLVNRGAVNVVEGELGRWVVELGGPLFVVALMIRLLLVALLMRSAIAALGPPQGRVTPLCIALGALPIWLTGPVTGQGSATGFAAISAILVFAQAHVLDTNTVSPADASNKDSRA